MANDLSFPLGNSPWFGPPVTARSLPPWAPRLLVCVLTPALLKPPAAGGVPLITGKPAVGSTLHCTSGSWAPDLLGSFLFRDPRSFAYTWRRNGTPIPGATQNSIHLSVQGQYRCAVTAANFEGSATQLSAVRNVVACVVPTLAHETIPQARTALGKARCTLGHVTGPTGTSARIKTQTPKPGTQLAPGSKVNVTTKERAPGRP